MSEEVLAAEADASSAETLCVEGDAPPSEPPPESAPADPDDADDSSVDDVDDEKFFSEGDLAHHDRGAIEGDALTVLDNAARKTEPYVVERRARFVRYVKWVVGGAALVCVAAIARTAVSPKTPAPSAIEAGSAP